jgi:hypothetical protein
MVAKDLRTLPLVQQRAWTLNQNVGESTGFATPEAVNFRLVTIDIHLFQKITLVKEFANHRNSLQ